MPVALQLLPQELRDRMMVVQQCREEDIDRVFDAYEVAGVAAELATFFEDLPYAYGRRASGRVALRGNNHARNLRHWGVRRYSYPCLIRLIMISWKMRPDSKKRARVGVSSRRL